MIRAFTTSSLGWVLTWAVLLVTALITRPLLPIDETRYVAAAWEMWTRGDFLVPHLNGETYSHKPPLMFWAIHAGWSVFGVNEWWPRLVSPLAGLAALFASRSLARRLWPDSPEIAAIVPWLLLGGLFWSLFTTVTMFDMWNALLAALGIMGLVIAAQGRAIGGFGLLGLAIGLGILAKGPVILLYTLPTALLAPWWLPSDCKISLGRWYLWVLVAIGLGAAIGLAWALPAAAAGGEAYTKAIFWGQTAGRVENSFAHGRPWWWYLPLMPLLLYPWSLLPSVWRGRIGIPSRQNWQLRLALVWFVPAFVAFCFVSGKQPHYMLPLFPALALLAARRLGAAGELHRRDGFLPGIALILLGGGLAGVTLGLIPVSRMPAWSIDVSPLIGFGLIAAGLITVIWRPVGLLPRVSVLALAGPATILFIHMFIMPAAAPAYDIRTASRYIAGQQAAGHPVAIRGEYHSQFHFLGRLTQPVEKVAWGALKNWMDKNPDGRMILTLRGALPDGVKPVFIQPYRGQTLTIWDARGISAHADTFRTN